MRLFTVRNSLPAKAVLLSGAALASLSSAPLHAQETETVASQGGVEDIVVTARRREENLQDVPVAISAFTGQMLEARNISDISSLDGLAPSVKVIESSSNTTTYIQIRGSVTANPNPAYEPAAALYIDGVYFGKAAGSTMDVADIANVEVLRGPQGTLFGRNTLAGAINIVTQKPSGELGGKIKVGAGDFGRRLLQGSIDLPRFGDFSVKLSGLMSERNGYISVSSNPYAGIPAQPRTVSRLGDESNRALRAAVRFEPTPDLIFDYAFDFNRIRNTPGSGTLQSVGEGGIFDPNSPIYSGVPLHLYVQDGKRPRTAYSSAGVDDAPLYERVKSYSHALTGTWDVGDATIKSITAFREMDWGQSLDLDASPLPIAAAASDLDYHQFSQELQASGTVGDQFNYTGGVYYFSDKGDVSNPQQFFGTTLESEALFKTRAYAVYGQVDYTPPILDEKLTLTAGLRYSNERKSITRFASAGGFVTIPDGTHGAKTFKGTTPTFIAKYAFSPDFNVYAKYSEGFKSGGYSADASTLRTAMMPYEQESVKSYEIGAKARLFDGKLQLNAAAYFDKHDDQQIQIFSPTLNGFVTLTANGARSEIKGFEVEATARPVDWLRISANVGHTDPRFTEYYAVEGGPNVADSWSFVFVPRWTASASGDVRLYKGDDLQVNFMVDLNYNSAYAALPYSKDPTYDPNIYSTRADAATVVDARLLFSKVPVGKSEAEMSFFVKNVFDDASRIAGIDFGSTFGNIVTRNYNHPRSIGFDTTLRF